MNSKPSLRGGKGIGPSGVVAHTSVLPLLVIWLSVLVVAPSWLHWPTRWRAYSVSQITAPSESRYVADGGCIASARRPDGRRPVRRDRGDNARICDARTALSRSVTRIGVIEVMYPGRCAPISAGLPSERPS